MLRIYLTDEQIEGYNEGCGCCSSTDQASMEDIKELISNLENQLKYLNELKFLVEKYGEANLVSWKIQYDNILYLKNRINSANKYEINHNISGTFYKECYQTADDDRQNIKTARKIFSKVPLRFKKYIGYSE